MGFIPPPLPAVSPEQLQQVFIDRKIGIRIGTMLQCVCYTFYLTWGMSIVMFIRRMERGLPILTYTSIANVGGGYVFFLLMPITWAMLAFRPEIMDPKFMQIMNDWVWFVFIPSWPPFAIFMIFIAIAIFLDHNVPTIFPRWVAFFNLWTAVLIIPAALIEFFKTGPFCVRRAHLLLVHLYRVLRLDSGNEHRHLESGLAAAATRTPKGCLGGARAEVAARVLVEGDGDACIERREASITGEAGIQVHIAGDGVLLSLLFGLYLHHLTMRSASMGRRSSGLGEG